MVPTSRQMGGGACSSIPFNLSVSLHRRNRTGTRSSVGAARALTRCAARADGSKTFIFFLVGTIPPPGAAEVDEIGPSCRSSRPPSPGEGRLRCCWGAAARRRATLILRGARTEVVVPVPL